MSSKSLDSLPPNNPSHSTGSFTKEDSLRQNPSQQASGTANSPPATNDLASNADLSNANLPAYSPAKPPEPYSAFSPKRKSAIVAIVTLTGFLGPLSGNVYIPLLPSFSEIFDASTTTINATVSVFMFVMAFSPLAWASFADFGGRKMLYLISLVFFIIANILLAALPANIVALFVLRIVQAFGASSVLSVGAGTVADVTEPKNRAKAISFFMLGPQLGPVIGPLVSMIANASDDAWRWIFGILAIAGGIMYFAILLCLPETLRHLVGNGSLLQLSGWFVTPHWRQKKIVNGYPKPPKPSIKNYLKLLCYIPVFLNCVNSALLFASFYAMSIEFSQVLQGDYNYSELEASLGYLCPGAFLICGSLISGRLSDRLKREASIPEHRLPLQIIGFVICMAGLLLFGWGVEKHLHVITLFVGVGLLSFGMSWVFVIQTAYLTECFRAQASSTVALVNMFRNSAAAVSALVIKKLVDKMTFGWAYTGLAFCLLIAIANVLVIVLKGGKWRETLRAEQEKRATK